MVDLKKELEALDRGAGKILAKVGLGKKNIAKGKESVVEQVKKAVKAGIDVPSIDEAIEKDFQELDLNGKREE